MQKKCVKNRIWREFGADQVGNPSARLFMSSKEHEEKSSSPPISSLLNEIFLKTEIQSMFGNLLYFFSNFYHQKEKQLHNTRKELYFEKFGN